MTISKSEGQEIAEAYLANLGFEGDLVVIERHTLEYDFGWVFFYSSKVSEENKTVPHTLAGNAPVIVDRSSGKIVVTGTAYPIEHYISIYEKCGNPHAEPSIRVRVSLEDSQSDRAKVMKLIRKYCGLSMVEAKNSFELALNSPYIDLSAKSVEDAQQLTSELEQIGISAEQLYE